MIINHDYNIFEVAYHTYHDSYTYKNILTYKEHSTAPT